MLQPLSCASNARISFSTGLNDTPKVSTYGQGISAAKLVELSRSSDSPSMGRDRASLAYDTLAIPFFTFMFILERKEAPTVHRLSISYMAPTLKPRASCESPVRFTDAGVTPPIVDGICVPESIPMRGRKLSNDSGVTSPLLRSTLPQLIIIPAPTLRLGNIRHESVGCTVNTFKSTD